MSSTGAGPMPSSAPAARYYPKLQVSVPFTPATGPRLLVAPRRGQDAVEAALLAGAKAALSSIDGSSIHVTFSAEAMSAAPRKARASCTAPTSSSTASTKAMRTYDDFLATLASRKRKAMKNERREALADGITIEWLTGSDHDRGVWDEFFAFYMDTGVAQMGPALSEPRILSR